MNSISEITRRDIYDLFCDGIDDPEAFPFDMNKIQYPYYGRLTELEFLDRLYDLDAMESYDSRYSNARGEIQQHTINNDDYPYCWIFTDDRFHLNKGDDEELLRFLCEVFHPYVRDEKRNWELFFNEVNKLLNFDGYELYPESKVSGRDVYGWRLCDMEKLEKKALIELIDAFKSGLLSKATSGDMDENDYKQYRDRLLEDPQLSDYVPPFIKSNRTAQDFRRYMQALEQHYVDRRSIINQQMDRLLEFVESNYENDSFMSISEYRQLERIGNGGYGSVYRYHNDVLDMDFAVKIYEPVFVSPEEQAEGEKRFFREAKMMFGFTSNYIAQIYDAGRINGKPYIRMELIKGYDLVTFHEKEGNLSFQRSAIVILHILTGLKNAHKHNVIHRDLKPSNIMFSEKDKLFKIIDFGVSAFLDTDNHTKLTKTGEHIAGGIYIDPLLQENPKLRDPRIDIYSVGAIWYYLLCGRAPSGSDMKEYLKKANEELLPEQIDIVMKCLSGNIDERFASCEELYDLIKPIAKGMR